MSHGDTTMQDVKDGTESVDEYFPFKRSKCKLKYIH